jgi:flagellar protein FlgJ
MPQWGQGPEKGFETMRVPTLQSTNSDRQAMLEEKKLKNACEDFEAVLTNILFKTMRETIPKGDPESQNNAMELYESMLDETVAQELSHGPGLGLGKVLFQQLVSPTKP